MKVTGFTIIRNAVNYDYPVVESIKSVLPLTDEFIILVGKSDDNTKELINSIDSPKIKIYDSIWDDNLRRGGKVLAAETDKAYKLIADDTDWCFYIQADEILHEKYLVTVENAMKRWQNNQEIDGLLFNYKHFYGSYSYVGDSYNWYRNEIRIIRKRKDIYSYLDAQGFRKGENQKLNVKLIDAFIYHYGWVREPSKQQKKIDNFEKLWRTDEEMHKLIKTSNEFDYSEINSLEKFTETHPEVMLDRIKRINWQFDFDISKKNYSTKDKIRKIYEKLTGKVLGEYRNYKII